ncbi:MULTISPECIES: Crp/Fnr family transcriptional regulator [Providencia]|uniref:Crp/Fnr family transcriptional regulator n=1 Tax=Providencia TaxID=586 RepID=UPI00198011C4|nr:MULTISPECIES: Crp/Fnr family transcriptional regulator [Providencia]HEC8327744.1 Crp/Fnr family transcriptional regulator [Providencia rettgeri]MBN4867033.1 Crp/Fnr family transcriptional regulator [Providencia stuartii]MBN4876535.1 Crp/Fnr family transcriptional regulator [Providencia stuartii]MBN4881047.1 Crp/Fnr family transcriptional regulator [Providencia stuartii]MBN4885555.1 Crp/Fnr family transcriptional regulator [Providencia stuartii]
MKRVNSTAKCEDFITYHNLNEIISEETLEKAKLIHIKAKEYLIFQDSKISHLYFLVKGKLQVERYETNGNKVVFSFENAFSILGDLELFQDDDEHDRIYNTIQAVTDADLLAIPLSIIRKKEINSPLFLQFICQHLSKKLYNASQLHSSASYSVEYKLRRYLSFVEKQYGVNFKLENRESLAAMLGVSVRQLNRTLSKLITDKLIELKGKQIKILNTELLLSSYQK